MNIKRIASLSVFAVILLFLESCGGTETGNPGAINPNSTPTASPATSSKAYEILYQICAKLSACNPGLAQNQCMSGVLPVTNIAPALNLVSGFGSYQAIIDAEVAHSITPNTSASTNCVNDISNLSCGAPAVVSAYNIGDPNNFTNVVNMIPTSGTSCLGVY